MTELRRGQSDAQLAQLILRINRQAVHITGRPVPLDVYVDWVEAKLKDTERNLVDGSFRSLGIGDLVHIQKEMRKLKSKATQEKKAVNDDKRSEARKSKAPTI